MMPPDIICLKEDWMAIRHRLVVGLLFLSSTVAEAAGPYDVLFRTGTLDGLAQGIEISYDQSGSAVESGAVQETDLRVTVENESDTYLDLVNGEKMRRIGVFPTDVGNPLLMYALEAVIRDMAKLTGGSPFYIRNRFKDAMSGDAVPEPVTLMFEGSEIAATRLTLFPFDNDPNAGQVPGLEELELVVDTSDGVPGWYHSISVRMPAAGGYDYRIAISEGDAR